MHDESKRGWKGLGIGCGLLALAPVVVVAVVVVRTAVPLRAAGRDLRELETRFGAQDSYAPAADGAIAAERLEAFLEVRSSLATTCSAFGRLWRPMQRVDRVTSVPDPTRDDVARASRDIMGVATTITPFVGEFLKRRNRALLDVGMGLGEYSYVFALAYRDHLLDPELRSELFSRDSPLAPEALEALRSMLALQRNSSGAAGSGALATEIASMERDPLRIPWADGLPEAVAQSLAPFRGRLEESYCDGLAGVELDRDSRRALRIALD